MHLLLAAEGRCRIDSLELDGQPIAMGVTIISGRTAALWKIAYDETQAAASPGVQFVLEYTRRQVEDDAIDVTDSCAIPDHPMIDRIWPERLAIADLFIATQASDAAAFKAGALDQKTKELIALAIAITTHCDGSIAAHAKGAARTGAFRSAIPIHSDH